MTAKYTYKNLMNCLGGIALHVEIVSFICIYWKCFHYTGFYKTYIQEKQKMKWKHFQKLIYMYLYNVTVKCMVVHWFLKIYKEVNKTSRNSVNIVIISGIIDFSFYSFIYNI